MNKIMWIILRLNLKIRDRFINFKDRVGFANFEPNSGRFCFIF